MFIELSEHLLCPAEHDDSPLVVATGVMRDRSIRQGTIGCPVCEREYLIRDGVGVFGQSPQQEAAEVPGAASGDAVQALLGITGPGGFVILLGSAGRLAADLAVRLAGVHFVGINAPVDVTEGSTLSLLRAPASVPLRRMARGVVVGGEYAAAPWLAEAARVLLPGRRLVVLSETVEGPAGVEPVAGGLGMWAGEKR